MAQKIPIRIPTISPKLLGAKLRSGRLQALELQQFLHQPLEPQEPSMLKKQVVHCLLLPRRHYIWVPLYVRVPCTRKKSLGMIPHWSLLSEALRDPDIHFCMHGTFGKNPSAPGSLLLFTTPWSDSWDARGLVDLSRKLESIQAVSCHFAI